ncbi:hypothetical protein DCS_07125 [Drechmeria coniospora]|uniref:EF-hand domain-containing protein n=1 Tax=Drechmeria coniospora TaxID=98403 RepID=A0A151GDN8_DRECN|nr:hypothetical protein DCS_07125 [Drechmeria coniospora]KYK55163.1 hypothetical protein DCS_07125 [Drechmeria coniospora]ODA82209.1 hypothetical protein RJ55_00716 [Drechmeria coniospora]
MNPHTTPRPYPARSIASIAGNPNQQPQQQHQPQTQQHQQLPPARPQRQPPAHQASANEEYGVIADEDRDHIDEVFDLMDMKKKGWLNSYEFKHSLAALGFELAKPDYFRELETYGSVPPDWQDPHSCPVNRLYIYLDPFRQCAAKLIAGRDPREEAAKVFNMFDYDGDGIISFDDMRHLAQDIKDDRPMSDEEIQSMIEHLDHEGKGGVNLDEFIQMMEEAG